MLSLGRKILKSMSYVSSWVDRSYKVMVAFQSRVRSVSKMHNGTYDYGQLWLSSPDLAVDIGAWKSFTIPQILTREPGRTSFSSKTSRIETKPEGRGGPVASLLEVGVRAQPILTSVCEYCPDGTQRRDHQCQSGLSNQVLELERPKSLADRTDVQCQNTV